MKSAIKKVGNPSAWMVDDSYQREPDMRRVEKIAGAFRVELLGVPVLSEREPGAFFCVDGWHRRMALVSLGYDNPVPCLVVSGISAEEEARLFYDLQKERRGHTAFGAFKARLKCQEPVALDIKRILKRHNRKLAEHKNCTTICAVTAVEQAYRRGTLDDTICVVCAWDGENPNAFDAPVIGYVSKFLAAYQGHVDLGRLAKQLKRETPRSLRNHIAREVKDFNVSSGEASVSVIRRVYNRGATPKAKLPLLDELEDAAE